MFYFHSKWLLFPNQKLHHFGIDINTFGHSKLHPLKQL